MKNTYFSKHVFLSLHRPPPASSSRLDGLVEQCYRHKTKKAGFNGLASPHVSGVRGGFLLGTVEVVFNQLLSAWLGVNRWTN